MFAPYPVTCPVSPLLIIFAFAICSWLHVNYFSNVRAWVSNISVVFVTSTFSLWIVDWLVTNNGTLKSVFPQGSLWVIWYLVYRDSFSYIQCFPFALSWTSLSKLNSSFVWLRVRVHLFFWSWCVFLWFPLPPSTVWSPTYSTMQTRHLEHNLKP